MRVQRSTLASRTAVKNDLGAMPQNYQTHNIDLSQRLYEALLEMPSYDPPRRGFIRAGQYRVVDLVLEDGRKLEGILALDDTLLLAPDVETFTAEEIVEMTSTPPERHPDFTITDTESVRDRYSIEWMNAERLAMFGPEDHEDEQDWRSAPLDEAWDEAIRDDRSIYTFAGEIPACWHGPRLKTLSDAGFVVSVYRVSDEETITMTIRPRTIGVWSQLHCSPNGLTLCGLVELLDLPEETARYVFAASMPHYYGNGTFEDWVSAVRERGFSPDPEIDFIEVRPFADTRDDLTIEQYFGASAMTYPLQKDDPETGSKKGERINYALDSIDPATVARAAIRYSPELIIPATHKEQMAYFRGARRDWVVGGEIGPKPEMPIILRAKRNITVAELIGAVLSETARASTRLEPTIGR
ncbi:MAG: hypothetical protein GEU90_19205 [Gemmatimonas sp.]|nr:hypothetical protein [Gemmatimonas sp.]